MTGDCGRVETNHSIFLRLNRTDTNVREIAWQEFHDRYAPLIASLARKLGTPASDVDDVVQEVLLGFYARSPTFVYDPQLGRFRGYLKTCTCHVLHKRASQRAHGVSLEQLDLEAVEVEQIWNDIWEQQLLRRAIEQIRGEIGLTKTFRAFELYVMLDQPPKQVSEELGLHIDNVYRSREQVTQMLRDRIQTLREED